MVELISTANTALYVCASMQTNWNTARIRTCIHSLTNWGCMNADYWLFGNVLLWSLTNFFFYKSHQIACIFFANILACIAAFVLYIITWIHGDNAWHKSRLIEQEYVECNVINTHTVFLWIQESLFKASCQETNIANGRYFCEMRWPSESL